MMETSPPSSLEALERYRFGDRKPDERQLIFVLSPDGAWRLERYCPDAHEPEDDAVLWCAAPVAAHYSREIMR